MKPTWHAIERRLLVTVAAGPALSLPARVKGVELNVAQSFSGRVLTERWKQLELHNSSPAFSLLRGRKKLWVRANAGMPIFNCVSLCMLYV